MKRTFELTLDSGETLTLGAPKLKDYNALMAAQNDSQIIAAAADIIGKDAEYILDNFTTDDIKRFIRNFPAWVQGVKESDPN